MTVLAMSNIDVIGWLCFALGAAMLVAGVVSGLGLSPRASSEVAKGKIDEAKSQIDEAQGHLAKTGEQGVAAGASVAAASASADAAKSALEEVQGIIGSLPENLRFAGLLVLIGTLLISVATVQFGGVTLF